MKRQPSKHITAAICFAKPFRLRVFILSTNYLCGCILHCDETFGKALTLRIGWTARETPTFNRASRSGHPASQAPQVNVDVVNRQSSEPCSARSGRLRRWQWSQSRHGASTRHSAPSAVLMVGNGRSGEDRRNGIPPRMKSERKVRCQGSF